MILVRLLLILLSWLAGKTSYRLVQILNGFIAKHVASAIFVSKRRWSEIEDTELKVGLFKIPSVTIDRVVGSVSVSMWGVAKRTAYFHTQRGCFLAHQPPERDEVNTPRPPRLSDSRPQASTTQLWSNKVAPWVNSNTSQTLALLIIQRGEVVAEWYRPGVLPTTPLPGWSMAKSVMNAWVGILVRQGKVDIHAPLPDKVWQGKPGDRSNITLHHLLQMSSGLLWTERYWWDSDVTRMLFLSDDASSIVTAKRYAKVPGTHWQYASGTTNVISKALKVILGSDYHHSLYRELFVPLGMDTAIMETDASGNYVGSSYMLASAYDWAKFGTLYLQEGAWQGNQILPDHWVSYTTTPATAAPNREYGAHFWLNSGLDNQPHIRKLPDVPANVFYASGFGGQRIFIVPDEEMVIVRLGTAHLKEPDFNHLLADILSY